MKWNVITWKNGAKKNHFIRFKESVTAHDVAFAFSLKYNGTEGEVLEIIPMEN